MERIKLYDKKVHENWENVFIEPFLQEQCPDLTCPPRPAIVIFPGGGYEFVSKRESEPIAHVFMAAGYSVFVVWYTVAPHCHTVNPLLDAAAAVAYVRNNADRFYIDPTKVAVCGFSAGGHLAAYISTCWHKPIIHEALGIDNALCRPDAMILGYPVITATNPTHDGSFLALTSSAAPSKEELQAVSIENLVDSRTPQAFIWHTSTDDAVHIRNSMLLGEALGKYNIPFEMHIFPKGLHGLSNATRETSPGGSELYHLPYVTRWTEFVVRWCENALYSGDFRL